MAIILLFIGSIGAVVVWLFAVRPYVVSHGKGYNTGANIGIAIWVDWQSCGEIAKAENDDKGLRVYRMFGMFQLIAAIGFLLLFFGV
jgi:hypothetical protein